MNESEFRQMLKPLARSWGWVFLTGGGFVLYGVMSLAAALSVVLLIHEHGAEYFWQLLNLPAGVLGVLGGWQFIKIARILAASLSADDSSNISDFGRRLRSAFVLTGAMILVEVFILFWDAVGIHRMAP